MNSIVKQDKKFSFAPANLEEAIRFAELISKSSFIPKEYKDKPGDVVIAIQWGAELGLPPLQSLQNISVINGKPNIWGDAALAIVQNHPSYEYHKEEVVQDKDGDHRAYCEVKRKGSEAHRVYFSVKDAKLAGLWDKAGTWKSYPKRMLQMRARGFALRDKFADALKGLILREEAMDYQIQDVTPHENNATTENHFSDITTDAINTDNVINYGSKSDKLAAELG